MSNVNEKLVQLEIDVLNENNLTAEENRRFFKENNILALNLVSSPGSGKTTLLCRTVSELKSRFSVSVIEGDQETINDAERIRATGVDAIQINTGEGCHLDAAMIKNALTKFPDLSDSVLFIENVGNLVCPASFDLGEFCKVAVLSVTEGEDKPIKYPYMFAASKVMIINKTDLLPYVDFSVDQCIDYARRVNPSIEVFLLSATKGDGMREWCRWIAERTAKRD